MVETINKLIRVSRQLLQELGREPTPEEIAEELETGKNTPRRWVTAIINELSVLLWGIDEERARL